MTQDAGGSQDFSKMPQDNSQGPQQQAPSQETPQSQATQAQGPATGPAGGQIWYYALEGRPYGPYSYEQLTAFARAGYFHPADYVYAPHIVNWVRADSIAGLFGAAASGGGFGPAGPAAPGVPYAAGGAWPQAQPAYAEYAGFWIRWVAAVIDWFVLLVPNCLMSFIVSAVMNASLGVRGMRWDVDAGRAGYQFFSTMLPVWTANTLIQTVICWVYFGLMESGPWQATVGKRALGLMVTDTSGRRISFARASGRYFASILSSIILFIGYIMGAFTERKQTLHDIMADTVVTLGRTQ
jgi:uncharacterized RDD family membrane protein YckC